MNLVVASIYAIENSNSLKMTTTQEFLLAWQYVSSIDQPVARAIQGSRGVEEPQLMPHTILF